MDLSEPITIPTRDDIEAQDLRLLDAIHAGLPLVPRPYAAIAARLRMAENEVIKRLAQLVAAGVIKRFGVVVRHHELGYRANAMVVWDVPDEHVSEIGRQLAQFDFVTLCYRRERSLPAWRYNLYCMIHGRDRAGVRARIGLLNSVGELHRVPQAVLFSRRRFKQCGADYRPRRDA